MNYTKFKIGDVVYLKNIDSHAMIIDEIDESTNTVTCVWHIDSGEPKSAKYSIECIEFRIRYNSI